MNDGLIASFVDEPIKVDWRDKGCQCAHGSDRKIRCLQN